MIEDIFVSHLIVRLQEKLCYSVPHGYHVTVAFKKNVTTFQIYNDQGFHIERDISNDAMRMANLDIVSHIFLEMVESIEAGRDKDFLAKRYIYTTYPSS